jgi:hypothetical protein
MPRAKRYTQEKEWREFDALLQTSGFNRSNESVHSLNQDLIAHGKYAKIEDGRRAAAYSQASNAKRQADAALRLAQFSAKYEKLLRSEKSSRQIARALIAKGADNRTTGAVATTVQSARKYLKIDQ